MFEWAKQIKTYEDIISQIQEAIIEGKFKPGDRLPSERTLTELFKVGRGTLREALRILEEKGLISIKMGGQGGPIVRSMDTKQMSESLDLLLKLQKVTFSELLEFRETLEGRVAIKAAQNWKKKDLKELESFIKSIKTGLNATELNWNDLIHQDNNFHMCLVRISGNKLFESVLSTLYENINRYYDRLLPKERWILEANYKDLCNIKNAIEKRNAKLTKLLVQRHLRLFHKIMREREKYMTDQNLKKQTGIS